MEIIKEKIKDIKNNKENSFKLNNLNLNKIDKLNLILGDSFIEMSKLESQSIDFIFIDPPYFLSNNGYSVNSGKRTSVNKGEWDKSKEFIKNYNFHLKWIKECQRILKPNAL